MNYKNQIDFASDCSERLYKQFILYENKWQEEERKNQLLTDELEELKARIDIVVKSKFKMIDLITLFFKS